MQEKRLYPRFQKQYTMKFALKDNPQKTYDMPRLLDISKGGLKFLSSEQYFLGTRLIFYIKFPFKYPDETVIEAEVVGVENIPPGKIYKTRVSFKVADPSTQDVLSRMEQINEKKSK